MDKFELDVDNQRQSTNPSQQVGSVQWTGGSVDPFLRKLDRFEPLSSDEKDLLVTFARAKRHVPPRTDIQREGDKHDEVRIVLDGFAVRYKELADGKRQIVAYLVPGDMCDPFGFILPTADHNIATLSPATVAVLRPTNILAVTEAYPAIARALWWSSMVDEATLREWLLNVGQRSSKERIAHLLSTLR